MSLKTNPVGVSNNQTVIPSYENCLQEITWIKALLPMFPFHQNIDQVIETSKNKETFYQEIKIPLLKALLTANQGSDNFFNHPFNCFSGIVSVFKCVYQAKKALAQSGFGPLEIMSLQGISRHLINRKRYDEAFEVVNSGSIDHENALLMLVEDLASVQAIEQAKNVANQITSSSHKDSALEEIEDAETTKIVMKFDDVPGITD